MSQRPKLFHEIHCGPKEVRVLFCVLCWSSTRTLADLTTKAVQGTSLALQSVNNIHCGDSLTLGVFSVGNGIADDILKEHLEHTTRLFVNESRDALDSSTTCQSTDGRFGDTLDVITEHLAVTLGASLSESLSSFATTGHDEACVGYEPVDISLLRLQVACGETAPSLRTRE